MKVIKMDMSEVDDIPRKKEEFIGVTEELEMRFSMGEKDFETIVSNIVGYSKDERVKKQRAKHSDDMDVDNLEACKLHTEKEDRDKYVAELEAYYYDEDPSELARPRQGQGQVAKERKRKAQGQVAERR